MKTKEVILEGWILKDEIEFNEIILYRIQADVMRLDGEAVECKVILEVPVPERSVTITESEFDETCNGVSLNPEECFYLKQKLFGSEG